MSWQIFDFAAAGSTVIDGANIYTGSITGNKIKAGEITGNHIIGGAVTTAHLSFTPVQSTNVVASINASAEGLRIQANRISIDGSVSFGSGYDPTTKATPADVTAAQTAAANDATTKANQAQTNAVTDVKNLYGASANRTFIDGAKIYTGSIIADALAAGSINTDKLSVGTVLRQNLVSNGHFGTYNTYGNSSSGWTVANGVTFIPGYGTYTPKRSDGSNASALNVPGATKVTNDSVYLYQDITVIPGRSYTLVGIVFGSNGNGGFYLRTVVPDPWTRLSNPYNGVSAGAIVPPFYQNTNRVVNGADYSTVWNTWRLFAYRVTIPNNITSVRIELGIDSCTGNSNVLLHPGFIQFYDDDLVEATASMDMVNQMQNVAFGGDMQGSYSNLSLRSIMGRPLNASMSSPSAATLIGWNGSSWTPTTVSSALGYTPVNKAGDTMSNTLSIISSASTFCGLAVTNQSAGWSWIRLVGLGSTDVHLATNSGASDGAAAGAFHVRPNSGSAGSAFWVNPDGTAAAKTSITAPQFYGTFNGIASASNAGVIFDTRAGAITPDDHPAYRTRFTFTNAEGGRGVRYSSIMTVKGWNGSYNSWQLSGDAHSDANEQWFLRSGMNTTWGPWREIIHSGNITSQSVAYASNADTVDGVHVTDLPYETNMGCKQDWTIRAPRSGFYQASTDVRAGLPSAISASEWIHVLNLQHTNVNNNFALQLAAGFGSTGGYGPLFWRSTGDNGNQVWSNIWDSNNFNPALKANLSGATFTGQVLARNINLDKQNGHSGMKWYSSTLKAWQNYMANAGTAGGVNGELTAPGAGNYVTSWALRSFVEATAGYGWTWESGADISSTPAIVAELSSNTGNFYTKGTISAPEHKISGMSMQYGNELNSTSNSTIYFGNRNTTAVYIGAQKWRCNPADGHVTSRFAGSSSITGLNVFSGMHYEASASNAVVGISSNGGAAGVGSNAAVLLRGDGSYGTSIHFCTTEDYGAGCKEAWKIDQLGQLTNVRGAALLTSKVEYNTTKLALGTGSSGWDPGALTNTGAIISDYAANTKFMFYNNKGYKMSLYVDGDIYTRGSAKVLTTSGGEILSGGIHWSTAELIDGAPWYGIGTSTVKLSVPAGTGAVQVSGYYGLRLRSNNSMIDLRQDNSNIDYYTSGAHYFKGGPVAINTWDTRMTQGTGNSLRLTTNSGYVEVGPQNTSYCHFYTDRPAYYFNSRLEVNDDIKHYGARWSLKARAQGGQLELKDTTNGLTYQLYVENGKLMLIQA